MNGARNAAPVAVRPAARRDACQARHHTPHPPPPPPLPAPKASRTRAHGRRCRPHPHAPCAAEGCGRGARGACAGRVHVGMHAENSLHAWGLGRQAAAGSDTHQSGSPVPRVVWPRSAAAVLLRHRVVRVPCTKRLVGNFKQACFNPDQKRRHVLSKRARRPNTQKGREELSGADYR